MSAKITIREAELDDVRSIAEVHVRGWRWGYRDLVPRSILDALSVEDRERQWTKRLAHPTGESSTFIADRLGLVVGFAFVASSADDDTSVDTAELQSL